MFSISSCNLIGVTYRKVFKECYLYFLMRFYTELPKLYEGDILNQPIFNSKGKITQRTKNALNNSLYLYSDFARKHSQTTENNPRNYQISNISIVGSGVENKIDSDIDFMLIVPKIDSESASNLKLLMSYILYCDRPKQEAVDIFIRQKDKYPNRKNKDITSQVNNLIDKYNKKILF